MVVTGTPGDVADCPASHTGAALRADSDPDLTVTVVIAGNPLRLLSLFRGQTPPPSATLRWLLNSKHRADPALPPSLESGYNSRLNSKYRADHALPSQVLLPCG